MPTSRPTPFCLCKPCSSQGCPGTDGGTKPAVDPRSISDPSAVYPRFISATRSAICSWLLTSVPTPICLCKPVFIYTACTNLSNQNPNITQTSRVGAHGGVAGRGHAELDANRTVHLGDEAPSYSSKALKRRRLTTLQKHEQAKSHSNRLVESKTRTHQGRDDSRQRAARQRGSAELNRTGRRYVNPARRKHLSCSPANLPSPKPGHTTIGSRRAHGSVARRGRASLYANRTIRLGENPFSYPTKHRRHVA